MIISAAFLLSLGAATLASGLKVLIGGPWSWREFLSWTAYTVIVLFVILTGGAFRIGRDVRHQKGIRLPRRSDAELEAIHRRDRHVRNRYYKQRQLAKKACPNACFYTPGLGLIPEAGCPVHDRPYVRAGKPHG